jgi:hypothetical protein
MGRLPCTPARARARGPPYWGKRARAGLRRPSTLTSPIDTPGVPCSICTAAHAESNPYTAVQLYASAPALYAIMEHVVSGVRAGPGGTAGVRQRGHREPSPATKLRRSI